MWGAATHIEEGGAEEDESDEEEAEHVTDDKWIEDSEPWWGSFEEAEKRADAE